MTAPPQGPRRRLLFIVSPERMDLYDALRTALARESDCEVVIDRRAGERREPERAGRRAPGGNDRRTRQRRERIPIDSEIRECGWTVVKVNTWPEAQVRRARPDR